MAIVNTEKLRFELAICRKKGRHHPSGNPDLFDVDSNGEYLNPEIKTLADGWEWSTDNLTLPSVLMRRYHFIQECLQKFQNAKMLSTSLHTKINLAFNTYDKYIDDLIYASDAYASIFAMEELLEAAMDEVCNAQIIKA